jgi:hypothetical protein
MSAPNSFSWQAGWQLAADGIRQDARQFGYLSLLRLAPAHLDHHDHQSGGRDEMKGNQRCSRDPLSA